MTTASSSPSSQNGSDRRRVPRYEMALDVAFGPAGSAGAIPASDQLTRTVTINLSTGGLCLYSDTRYPVGAQLNCQIGVPGRDRPIEAVGSVVWFQRANDERGYKLGLEFARLAPEHRAALDALLAHPPAGAPPRATRVLLVEDDEELRRALALRFEAAGFRVITASDGLEALHKGREERPNLIILDLMLPHLSGFEVCRILKFDPKFAHIPIILFTARSHDEDVQMGRAVGADAYLKKPFDGADLLAKVEELLRQHPS